LHFRAPSEFTHHSAAPTSYRSSDRSRLPDQTRSLTLLSFIHPTTRYQPGGSVVAGRSLYRRVPRAGFGYPLRDIHNQASRHDKHAGASMGFTLQGLSLDTIGTPLGAHALRPFPPSSSLPERSDLERRAAPGLRSRVESVPSVSRRSPTADPFLGFYLSRAFSCLNWLTLWSRSLPSHPWAV